MKQITDFHLLEEDGLGSLTVFDARSFLENYGTKAFRAHRHSHYQLIWFTSEGQHYVDYKTYEHPENALFFIDKEQVHYFCEHSVNEGHLMHFNDQFLQRHEFSHENWTHYRLFHEMTAPYLELSGEFLHKL